MEYVRNMVSRNSIFTTVLTTHPMKVTKESQKDGEMYESKYYEYERGER